MKNSVCFLVVLAFLTACASQPTKSNQANNAAQTQANEAAERPLSDFQEPQRSIVASQRIDAAINTEEWEKAVALLQQVELNASNSQKHSKLMWQASIIATQNSVRGAALEWYIVQTTTNQETPSSIYVDERSTAAKLRFQALMADQQRAGEGLVNWLNLADSNLASTYDTEPTWESLLASTAEERSRLANYAEESNATGWLSLAAAFHTRSDGYQKQLAELINWKSQWLQHPASLNAPKAVDTVFNYPIAPEKRAAVVLPLSGKLAHIGRALQAGILASHSYAPQFEQIHFVDSQTIDNLDAFFISLGEKHIDVIIGPLDKTLAQQLAVDPNRSQHQISLNRFDGVITDNVLQLSLMIEDEAEYLAEYNANSSSRPLLISSPHPVASRSSRAFESTWLGQQEDANTESALASFELSTQDKYSDEIKAALLLSESFTRLREIEDVFVKRMENNLRRREDIDSIVISATPAQPRAITPLLAYHFAGDLPVYATSLVFDGSADSNKNRDINGIIFADTPWASSNQDHIKATINKHIQLGGTASKNLHALAIDGYFLAAAYSMQDIGSEAFTFTGRSGEYRFSANDSTRIPQLATIRAGKVEAYVAPAPINDIE